MIYYAHVNEDNFVENLCLHAGSYMNLFSIAGSGERTISLLDDTRLKHVFVVDVNKEALHLTALKIKALQYLSIEEYLFFIGGKEDPQRNRLKTFKNLAPLLSHSCRTYWENNIAEIKRGLLKTGHFETFLDKIRPLLRIWLGSSFYNQFREPEGKLGRITKWRWKFLKYLFSQRWTYVLFGLRDPAFTGPSATLAVIPHAIDRTLAEGRFHQSFMNHLVFLGNLSEMSREDMPLSLNPDFLLKVKKRLNNLEIHFIHDDLLNALKQTDNKFFHNAFFSLSDILSFEAYEYIRQVLQIIQTKSTGFAKALLRTFLRNQLDRNTLDRYLEPYGKITDLSNLERTGMYQVFDINIENESS